MFDIYELRYISGILYVLRCVYFTTCKDWDLKPETEM